MRIAFVNHSRRKVGGAEVYLDAVIPALAQAGHEVACLYEGDSGTDREEISVPDGAPRWSVEELGAAESVKHLKDWRPDVCFTHGLYDVSLESEIAALGHSALYVHNYYGTCISGDKTLTARTPTQCQRVFGAECLAHYYPDRCGGRNPITMWQRFRLQSKRLDIMHTYRTLIANSEYMERELERHGLRSECVYPFTGALPESTVPPTLNDGPLTILFVGRMHRLKGGNLLVDATSKIQWRLGRKLNIVFAGDGPARASWESDAARLRNADVAFDFTGWLPAAALKQRIAQAHVLAMPSVWPEPFGLAGLEAGLFGVPTVAFAVGGIPEWLHDGINGHLAALPATSTTLEDAIVRALSDEKHYQQLRRGALERAANFPMQTHLLQLVHILERCAA